MLAMANAIEDSRLFVLVIFRDQDRNRLANDFLGRVAEQPFSAAIPAHDHAIEILADDRIVGIRDNGGKLLLDMLSAAMV